MRDLSARTLDRGDAAADDRGMEGVSRARPGASAPTVLLADDHRLLRLSIRDELEHAGFEVCAEASTAAEAVEAAVRHSPDLCLLDVSMPGSGLHAVGEIGRRVPRTKVVMLTASSSEECFLQAVCGGARGYVLKEDDPSRLAPVLHDVLAGVPAFPRRFMEPLVAAARAALCPVVRPANGAGAMRDLIARSDPQLL